MTAQKLSRVTTTLLAPLALSPWAMDRPNLHRRPKPRETVIQPERLPIKDDDLPDAASSTTFACPETHMEHSGGISVDWASLQDFLLPEFAAVLQMNFQE
ncbi:hypothetical protein MRX96_001410 [Rhipicephalus microplus]